MNPLTAIHARWAADATLNGLLAATLVSTGTHLSANAGPDGQYNLTPYATIVRGEGDAESWRSNAERIDKIAVAVTVYHDAYAAGQAIAEAVDDAFNGAAFALDGNDRVIDMRCPPYVEAQSDAGVWSFAFDFTVVVHWGAA